MISTKSKVKITLILFLVIIIFIMALLLMKAIVIAKYAIIICSIGASIGAGIYFLKRRKR